MDDAVFRPTLELAALPMGRMRSCKVGEREIVLCHTRDGVYAVDNMCTHAFARLSEGYLKGTRITCPLHGATFDVRDGRVLGGPTIVPVTALRTRVVDGTIEVAMQPAGPT